MSNRTKKNNIQLAVIKSLVVLWVLTACKYIGIEIDATQRECVAACMTWASGNVVATAATVIAPHGTLNFFVRVFHANIEHHHRQRSPKHERWIRLFCCCLQIVKYQMRTFTVSERKSRRMCARLGLGYGTDCYSHPNHIWTQWDLLECIRRASKCTDAYYVRVLIRNRQIGHWRWDSTAFLCCK